MSCFCLWLVSVIVLLISLVVSRIVAKANRIDAKEEAAENDFYKRCRIMAEK